LQNQAAAERRKSLKQEMNQTEEKLGRLNKANEQVFVGIQTPKHERDIARASLDRIATQAKNDAEVTPVLADVITGRQTSTKKVFANGAPAWIKMRTLRDGNSL
jgi:hypothetical protein